MYNSTTQTYEMKREILNFSQKLSKDCGQVQNKFLMDMIYGLLNSKSVLLSDISDSLNENIKKINTIDRLSVNLQKELCPNINTSYLKQAVKTIGENPVVLVDDSDVIKPYGFKFEELGLVRDGSSKDNKIEKGYIVTEMVAITENQKQPISLFSHVHSSKEKEYKSTNDIAYNGLSNIIKTLNTKATFVFDRGYDMNELFQYMYEKTQNFVIRLTEKRKIYNKGKWYKSTTLRDSRKGKIKTKILFQGEEKECYITHLNVQITAKKQNMNMVIVYGLSDVPMMLASNIEIRSKEDAINVVRTYMSRWRIEEYFRFKKQEYDFENFRIRDLKAINNLNLILTYAIGMIAMLAEKIDKNTLPHRIIKSSNALRPKVLFWFYQLSKGISNILSFAKSGITEWKNIRKSSPLNLQLSFNLET